MEPTFRKTLRLRVQSDQRGKITSGRRGKSGRPEKLDHFNISKFHELMEVYGEKPQKLIVYFPSNNLHDFIHDELNIYVSSQEGNGEGGVKVLRCDGETCEFFADKTIAGVNYKAGTRRKCVCATLTDEERKAEKYLCKVYHTFKAFIARPEGIVISPIPYLFQNRAEISSANIISSLEMTWQLTHGKLVGVPFVLTCKMIKKPGITFPVWNLQPAIATIPELLFLADRGWLPTRDEDKLQIDLTANMPLIEPEVIPVQENGGIDPRRIQIADLLMGMEKSEQEAAVELHTISGYKSLSDIPEEELDAVIEKAGQAYREWEEKR